MAGAGQPWYMPALWPVGNVAYMFGDLPKNPKPAEAAPYLGFWDNLTAFVAALRSVGLAYACVYWMYDDKGDNPYPAFGPAKEWSTDWMLPILVRDLIATVVVCGVWDYLLYFSPLKAKLQPFKFQQQYPPLSQFQHNIFWTLTASVQAAALEIVLCHYWATGALKMDRTLSASPVFNVLFALFLTHIRIPHFYFLHRALHPWRRPGIPDLGKWLYKHVHSLHHKATAPTAWSGTAMHPVEATGYYSACLIPVAAGAHPIFAVAILADCFVGAALGHDGHGFPGSGDKFHDCHHEQFDCNYGAMHCPMDYWFGTYAGSKEETMRIWRGARLQRTQANKKE